jgi:hypothetical protein
VKKRIELLAGINAKVRTMPYCSKVLAKMTTTQQLLIEVKIEKIIDVMICK